MFSVVYSEDAVFDLKEISDYIAIDNPFYAREVVDKIYSSIEILERFPYIGKSRNDDIREIVEPLYKFRIFYRVSKNIIYVISIFRGKDM